MSKYNNTDFRTVRGFVFYICDNKCAVHECLNLASDAHHIDKNALNNHPFNVMPLCKEHHKLAHISRIDFSYWHHFILLYLVNTADKLRLDLNTIQ